jgi:hypothetical protein
MFVIYTNKSVAAKLQMFLKSEIYKPKQTRHYELDLLHNGYREAKLHENASRRMWG